MEECKFLLSKRKLLATDVIELNQKIFGNTANEKHRSYKRTDILQILEYQKKHKLNNTQLARQFNLSRNSVRKWKKIFLI